MGGYFFLMWLIYYNMSLSIYLFSTEVIVAID